MSWLFPKIYERYFAKQIYASFGFILFALLALFLFFDILSEQDALHHIAGEGGHMANNLKILKSFEDKGKLYYKFKCW